MPSMYKASTFALHMCHRYGSIAVRKKNRPVLNLCLCTPSALSNILCCCRVCTCCLSACLTGLGRRMRSGTARWSSLDATLTKILFVEGLKSVWLFDISVHVAVSMSVIGRGLIYSSSMQACIPVMQILRSLFADLTPVGMACSKV